MKSNYIKSLIQTAQETIWRNELAKEYAIKFADSDKDREEKVKGCDLAIEKDHQYIAFLNEKLVECESLA